ncbi:glycosyltransferase family 2 protein [Vibrio toranzoniae]|uniref:glycosyltransferase family 2 protein n=1 Tax=Vibrio toranzoniae TaxID=1194427 RepID=UPI00137740EF|nr:glycosyltransferase family 2 protein [Vibrio toranzoniae]NAZ91663.1 rhamnosyltransferase [Vibrio toranzoniae]
MNRKLLYDDVGAVIVTYEPDVDNLAILIEKLSKQVSSIVIVDNASNISFDFHNVSILKLHTNLGIAEAQNIGIATLIDSGLNNIILFDQDSLPSLTMVHELFVTKKEAEKVGIKVAAIGPTHIDQDTFQENIFISAERHSVNKVSANSQLTSNRKFTQCSFLIASGCLISKEAIVDIGNMESKLFIDCVDIEWGFRAVSKGWSCIGSFEAKMFHKIGEEPLKLMGRSLTTHSPLRHYYFYRNLYSLLKRPYIPFCWKLHAFVKSSLQAVLFSIFLKPRIQHFQCILQGVFHGLVNRSGKYE